VALVFAREVNGSLTGLVKKLEAATQTHSDCSFRAVVVLLSDDDAMEKKLKELAEKEGLKKVVLAIESPSGPPNYKLAKDAEVTVLLYEHKKVKKNFAFEKGKLTDNEADTVVGAVKDILPEKKADK
jgi:hypothetical protein